MEIEKVRLDCKVGGGEEAKMRGNGGTEWEERRKMMENEGRLREWRKEWEEKDGG